MFSYQRLQATYGRNLFLVTYSEVAARQFPNHVRNATLYGRLLGERTIVNVDIALVHDDKVTVP